MSLTHEHSPIKQEPAEPAPPVVLIGIDGLGSVQVVGLYETEALAQQAVKMNQVPQWNYSIVTPKMNSAVVRDAA